MALVGAKRGERGDEKTRGERRGRTENAEVRRSGRKRERERESEFQ